MSTLTVEEHDAVQELFNIGIGASASALSEMLGEEVLIGVPRMDVFTDGAFPPISTVGSRVVCAIDQRFGTPHGDGTALLMFPEEQCVELVEALLGEPASDTALSELEQEALKETGNIILNACIASVGNMMSAELQVELPHFSRGNRVAMLTPPSGQGVQPGSVIVLAIRFELRERKISGELAFLLALDSLKGLAQNMLEQVG